MTRETRSKKNIEKKITELYVRLHRRQTTKLSRKQNLKARLEFFKGLLQEIHDQESTSSNSDLVTPSSDSLSLSSGE
jgi:hypothetical protein